MKIAIPTEDYKGLKSEISDHFGRCDTFTFLDENGELVEIIKNTSRHKGGKGLPPELIKRHRADVLICKGIGQKALGNFKRMDIEVYVCRADKVEDAFKIWKNKQVSRAGMEDVCEKDGR